MPHLKHSNFHSSLAVQTRLFLHDCCCTQKPGFDHGCTWSSKYFVLFFENDATLVVEARERPLFKEDDILGRKSKVRMLSKKSRRQGSSGVRCHDVPGRGDEERKEQRASSE